MTVVEKRPDNFYKPEIELEILIDSKQVNKNSQIRCETTN